MPGQEAPIVAEPAIRLRSVNKSFIEGIAVLDGVSLDVPHGEVTALVGANGSGKSTLVKVLSGYHDVDAGSQIVISGVDVTDQISPELMRQKGVRFVHQDSALAGGMSVLDNMSVGNYRTGFLNRILWRQERESVRNLLARWRIDAYTDANVESLPLPTVAKLAVLRALRTSADEKLNAVVLDEPTAALGQDDANEVMTWVRELAVQENVGILFISHRLEEILKVADHVAVLRNGKIVAHEPSRELSHDRLVEHIVGGAIEKFYPDRTDTATDRVAMSVRNLAGGQVHDVSFSLAEGEVLGVTGIPGSGFEEVPYLLMDPTCRASGECEVGNRPLDLRRTTIRERIERGMVLIPADRKRTALATEMTIRENMSLPRLRSFIRRGLLSRRAENSDATRLVNTYQVRPPRPQTSVSRLSGGNQQKVVIAKWFSTAPAVLLVHEPTQAVDVGTKSEIFRLIADFAAAGTSAVIASVEYEDLAHLCDRVLVMGHGRVSAELVGDALTPERITAASFFASAEAYEAANGA